MQNDDVTWSIINKHHCSYKIKTDTQWFCRNEYNVTGLCNRKGCPLANSQYATVREEKGIVYLFVRRAECVYKPCQAWEKVKLSKTFVTALQQIEDTLVFWPNYFKQKCRQRLLKITQYLARMRKMKLHDSKKLVPVRRKQERRLAKREEKALVAARLDNVIEKQLLERLKSGTYERIYNFPTQAFDVRLENEEEIETDDEFDIEGEELEEEGEDGERVQMKVEHGEDVEEEEMDEELQQELERGVVREMREEDSSDEEAGEDDVDAESDEDADALAMEDDSDVESDEEDPHTEFVADFNESSDEEPEMDIEDLPQKLMPKARAVASGSRKRNDDDSSDQEEQDKIHRKKYNPAQPVRPSKKFALKKMQTKQKLRALYEKEKMEKEKKKVRIGAGRR